MRRFYAPAKNFDKKTVFLDEGETRHLRDVLRLREGDDIHVFDGEGREFRCQIMKIAKSRVDLLVDEEVAPAAPESSLDLTLAPAILKGEKFDLVIQKSVELGVKHLVPLITQRSDVKLKDRRNRIERWQRIALEAAKQSGRASLMRIEQPRTFAQLLDDSRTGPLVLFSERDGKSFDAISAEKEITAITGPEGGWEDSEIAAARDAGAAIITLGGRILRAETAAVAIAAILQHRFGDLN
jgi:16S rRNA (uracil1498-N3)-methyltransferase